MCWITRNCPYLWDEYFVFFGLFSDYIITRDSTTPSWCYPHWFRRANQFSAEQFSWFPFLLLSLHCHLQFHEQFSRTAEHRGFSLHSWTLGPLRLFSGQQHFKGLCQLAWWPACRSVLPGQSVLPDAYQRTAELRIQVARIKYVIELLVPLAHAVDNQPTTRLLCGYYACVFPPNLPLKHKERVYDAACPLFCWFACLPISFAMTHTPLTVQSSTIILTSPLGA